MEIKINFYLKLFITVCILNLLIGCTGNSSNNNTVATGNKTYITSENNGIQECTINSNGSLNDCKAYTNEFLTDPDGMALYFDIETKRPYMFISNYEHSTIVSCEINEDGSMGTCFDSQATGLDHPEELEVLNIDDVNFLLIGNETSGGVTRCNINAGAKLSNCTSLIPDVSSNSALVTYTNRDAKTEYNHTYIYVNTISNEQNKQLLRCNMESSGEVHNCEYQATAYFESTQPGIIDAMSIHSDYLYITFQNKNQILACPINDGLITNCNATTELTGPYEITFSNLGLSDDGLPQVKAYITSLENHIIYTCDIDDNTRLPKDCVATDDVDVKAPRNIITSTNIGNIDNVVKQANLYEKTENVQRAGWFDNITTGLRTFGRVITSPACGAYLELTNYTSNPIKISFKDSNTITTINRDETKSFYHTTDGSTEKMGKIIYSDGTEDKFSHVISKAFYNCTGIVRTSGANVVTIPYELWVSNTPTSKVLVTKDATLLKHRNYFRTAAGASLLAYATVFMGDRSALENQALNDLRSLGYSDFLEVTSLDAKQNPSTSIASSNNDLGLLIYQDEHSNGAKLLDDNGMPTNISYDAAFTKSTLTPFGDIDLVDGKILLAYNRTSNTILIAYRGTATKVNVFVDIVATKDDWRLPKPEINPYIGVYLAAAKVHTGFSAYRAVLFNNAIVRNWINSHGTANTEYVVTGHSLGGAAASLLSAYLLSDGIAFNKLNVITFGQPAVGNDAFATAYTMKSNGNMYYSRIINDYDPVGVITSPIGYEHYGTRVGLAGMTDSINTHSMDGYYNATIFYGPL